MSMNARRLAICLLLGYCMTVIPLSQATAREPMLQVGERVLSGGQPLKVEAHAIPCVHDWNNDGRKDLIVGYRYGDKVALYLNQGSDSQPEFSGFVNLQANGEDIWHPGAGCGAPAPWVCDYDADGKKDLLVGTGSEGYVYFYKNTNTDAEPILASGMLLTVSGATLDVGIRATPYVHDWDEDGLRDLMCGDGNGNVHLFKNVGTGESPEYVQDVLIQAGGVSVNFGSRSAIRVLDWDGDGLKDLLGSASNNASWCKNVGTNAAPVLNAPVSLRAPQEGIGLVNIDTGYRMRLEVVDWNNDNVSDLLIGTDDGYIVYYEGYDFAVSTIEKQSNGEILLRWNSAEYLTYTILAGDSPGAFSSVATGLVSEGKTTTWSDAPGGGIRFYRIQVAE
jgi:hypothetical protein